MTAKNKRQQDTSVEPMHAPANDANQADIPAAYHQTNFWLTEAESETLDSWVYQLRRGGWRAASRSSCVRAMIHAMRGVPLDLDNIADEMELVNLLKRVISEGIDPKA